jgi:cell division protein FtsL
MATMAMGGAGMDRMHLRRPRQRRGLSVAEQNRELYEKQRSQRRGSTPEMMFAKYIDNSRLVKADDLKRRREMRTFTLAMVLSCMLTIAYVWQQVAAIEMGYRVEAAKHQVELMREHNRDLRLAEAQLSDPNRIDRMARQIGLDAPLPGQVVRPEDLGMTAPVLAEVQGIR